MLRESKSYMYAIMFSVGLNSLQKRPVECMCNSVHMYICAYIQGKPKSFKSQGSVRIRACYVFGDLVVAHNLTSHSSHTAPN